MILVLIESPFAPSPDRAREICRELTCSWEEALRVATSDNTNYLKECLRECCLRGEAPFASHLFYTQFLDDTIPRERSHGIDAGLAWGKHAAKTIVYVDLGISNGMRYGLKSAELAGRPIEYRKLGRADALQFFDVEAA